MWLRTNKNNLFNVLKPLTQQQSHGIITKYELTKGERREIDVGLNKLCYNFTLGNERSDQIITVSARNSAGLSPPSTIIVPGYPGEHSKYIQKNFKWVEKAVLKRIKFLTYSSQAVKWI